MTDEYYQTELRRLVKDAGIEGEGALDLRRVWATIGRLRQYDRWLEELRVELNAINVDLGTYMSKLELAKFGHGTLPGDEDLDAIIVRIRGLEAFLSSAGRGEMPA